MDRYIEIVISSLKIKKMHNKKVMLLERKSVYENTIKNTGYFLCIKKIIPKEPKDGTHMSDWDVLHKHKETMKQITIS